jgi:FkbM family methyltransferase
MSIRNKIEGFRQVWQFSNRWQLITSRIFFPHEPINIYRLRDICFLADHSAGDANGAREIISTPMYRKFFDAMKLDQPFNLLDLGSSNGGFPLLLKASGFELKKIACVEMNPNTFSRMRFNIERNFSCELVLLNAAVCGESQELALSLGSGSTGDSIFRHDGQVANNTRAYNIKGMTFDEIYRSAFGDAVVDLCKIDIEEAEYEVFKTPEHSAIKKCRNLLIEIHEGKDRDPKQIIAKLNELGFVELAARKDEAAVYGFKNSALEKVFW